jgi:NitT/TauT family transport system substrate-binding protein
LRSRSRGSVLGQPSEGFIYIPIYVARTKGFFEQESLDAEVITFSKGGVEALAAVLGGQSDIYIGSPTVQLRAQEKGQSLKSFAAVQTQFGSDLVLSPDVAKRIDLANLSDPRAKAAALKGLTIAVAGPGSLTDLMVRHIAQFAGLNPDRDMTITPIGGGGSMLAAFGQKRIDGYALSAPTSTTGIERFGGAMLFNFAKGEYPSFANFLFYTLIARNDWIAGRSEMAQKVVRALWKGLRFAKTNPDEAREAVRPFFAQVPKSEFDVAWALSLPSFGDNPKSTRQVCCRTTVSEACHRSGRRILHQRDRRRRRALHEVSCPMTEIKLVRVFTHMGRGGNPCPIVVDASNLSSAGMQSVARHFGHESGFVLPAPGADSDYAFRFWVPRHEMEMCGHATIGALWVLSIMGRLPGEQVRVETRSGPVTGYVDRGSSGEPSVEISQPVGKVVDLTRAQEEDVLSALKISRRDLLDLPVQNAVTSRVKTLIPMKGVRQLNELVPAPPQIEACCERIESTGLYPYAVEHQGERRFEARRFPKSSGYPEDAATGIAAAALAFGLLRLALSNLTVGESPSCKGEPWMPFPRSGYASALPIEDL